MTAPGIYLDWNADAPVGDAAWDAYVEASQYFGNPSSSHSPGREAKAALQDARARVGRAFGLPAESVIFTSGGTESDALAISGSLHHVREGSVLVAEIEHPAVLKNLEAFCEERQLSLIRVPVDAAGVVQPKRVEAHLREDTVLLTVMMASNETGVVQPIQELAAVCRRNNILMHTDAVQAVGRLPVSMPDLGVHMMTISGHKFGGLGGTGALLVEPGLSLEPFLTGGGQESGMRGGTENVAGAACMAAALENLPSEKTLHHWQETRDRFEASLMEQCPDIEILGAETNRLVNTSCVQFKGCPGDAVLMALDIEGIFVSTGSACSSGSVLPSQSLMALGMDEVSAREHVRFSFPPNLSESALQTVLEKVVLVVQRMRTIGKV